MVTLRIYENGELTEIWRGSARSIYNVGFHILRRARFLNELLPIMICSNGKIAAWLLEVRHDILEERYIKNDLEAVERFYAELEELQ